MVRNKYQKYSRSAETEMKYHTISELRNSFSLTSYGHLAEYVRSMMTIYVAKTSLGLTSFTVQGEGTSTDVSTKEYLSPISQA